MEQLLTTVLLSDRDGDFTIEGKEANMLLLRLRSFESEAGQLELDETKLGVLLSHGHEGSRAGSLREIMTLLRTSSAN